MKRSSRVALVMLASVSGLAVSGCEPVPEAKTDAGGTFTSKAECVAVYDQNTCDAAEKLARSEHLKNAPKTTREKCIAEYGADMCRPASEYGGSNDVWMPLMMGYMMGSMNSTPAPLYYGPGSYRDRDHRQGGGYAPVYSSSSSYKGKQVGSAPYAAPSKSTATATTKSTLKSTTSLTPPGSQRGGFGTNFKPTNSFKSAYTAPSSSSSRPAYSSSSSYSSKSYASSRGGFGSSARSYGGGGFGG